MIRLLITTIILFFGASATFAQTSGNRIYYCLHTDSTVYMKVVIFERGGNLSLTAHITELDETEQTYSMRRAEFAGRKAPYDYFQTMLMNQNRVLQSTYAVPTNGDHVFVSNTSMDGNINKDDSEIVTITYLCKDTPFN